jgi:hypothetical protein
MIYINFQITAPGGMPHMGPGKAAANDYYTTEGNVDFTLYT